MRHKPGPTPAHRPWSCLQRVLDLLAGLLQVARRLVTVALGLERPVFCGLARLLFDLALGHLSLVLGLVYDSHENLPPSSYFSCAQRPGSANGQRKTPCGAEVAIGHCFPHPPTPSQWNPPVLALTRRQLHVYTHFGIPLDRALVRLHLTSLPGNPGSQLMSASFQTRSRCGSTGHCCVEPRHPSRSIRWAENRVVRCIVKT